MFSGKRMSFELRRFGFDFSFVIRCFCWVWVFLFFYFFIDKMGIIIRGCCGGLVR